MTSPEYRWFAPRLHPTEPDNESSHLPLQAGGFNEILADFISSAEIDTFKDAAKNGADAQSLARVIAKLGNAINETKGGVTLLSYAAQIGNVSAVQSLLEHGATINQTSRTYDDQRKVYRLETPLVSASRLGQFEAVKCLAETGAHIDLCDQVVGKSALHWACARNHVDVSRYLVQMGANVNMADYYCETPIVEAIGNRNLELVEILVSNGVYLDVALNYDRDTALLFALLINELTIACFLISNGAKVNVSNNDGEDALDVVITCAAKPDIAMTLCCLLLAMGFKISKSHFKKALSFRGREFADLLERDLCNPKPLKDIARIYIRNFLTHRTRGRSIISHVKELPLPVPLIDCILMEKIVT